MKLTNKSSKVVGYLIGIIIFVGLIAGITYAAFNWRSTNTNISVNTKCFDVEGDNTLTVQGNDMLLFDEDDILDRSNRTITYKNGMIYSPFKIISDSECDTDAYFEIKVSITDISEGYTSGSIKYAIIEDMSIGYTQEQYLNPLNQSLHYLYVDSIKNTGEFVAYSNVINKDTLKIPAIIFYVDGDLIKDDSLDLVFNATVETSVNAMNLKFNEYTAAEYITQLYLRGKDEQITKNGVNYQVASSIGLMNDRLGGTTESFDGGNIRYYGSNPNNYVWLGDNYIEDFRTFSGSQNTLNVERHAGDRKLWRIIGVFDGRLKLISKDPISVSPLPRSVSDSNLNGGYGINQWGSSGSYEGSDLMKLLNEGYTGTNGSLYWNKDIGTVYTNYNNATTAGVSFANTGLSQCEKDMIDTVTWYLGAINSTNYGAITASASYSAERQSAYLGKQCSGGKSCNDTVTRTATWEGKVGLMYVSDVLYSTFDSSCWIFSGTWGNLCLLTPASDGSSASKYASANNSYSNKVYPDNSFCSIYPSIFLLPETKIIYGSGTYADPYVLSLSE